MIAIVLGTRAELIKLFPVMRELDKRQIPWKFVHTGQHNIYELLKELKVKSPDVTLDFAEHKSAKFRGGKLATIAKAAYWSLKICLKIRQVLSQIKPDVVICQGDTMANASTALAVRSIIYKRPLLAHVEAGIRTYDLFEPFPEEFSRRVTDLFSDILLAPTKRAANNLSKELTFGRVFVVGNTIVDAVNHIVSKRYGAGNKFVIAQIHRQENVNSRARMRKFVELILAVPYKILLVVHGNTEHKLKEFGLWRDLAGENVEVSEIMGYSKFLNVLQNSAGIITDSGGVQEECCILKKPCLIFREKTERPEAIEAGAAKLIIHSSPEESVRFLNKDVSGINNPFGENVSIKIVDILEKHLRNN